MLTLTGLIGKIVELILSKVIGRQIDLALDEKRRAARAFVRFHESLNRLTSVLDEFLKYTQSFLEERNFHLRFSLIESHFERAKSASKEFLESLDQLGSILFLYDPTLGAMLSRISRIKGPMINNVYAFFVDSKNGWDAKPAFSYRKVEEYFCSLELALPNDKIIEHDWEQWYKSAEQGVRVQGNTRGEVRAIEDSMTAFTEFMRENFETIHIEPTDVAKLSRLHSMLKEHRRLLCDSTEGLRKFIGDNFSISDVLSVS
jgi:hypothetical protein